MLSFDDKVNPLVGVAEWARSEPRMRSAARDLFPGGQTAWLDATDEAVRAIQRLKDPTRINAVVMLTDGEDTSSEWNVAGLRRRLEAQARSEGLTVRVYTIAYGSQANKQALRQIAEAAGGKAFEGDPKEIESVYTSISSFF
jgi:Ca-activated chloride channel family protein